MKSLRLVIIALLFLSVAAFSVKNADALIVGIDKEPASSGVVYWNKSMSTNKFQITNTNTQEFTWYHLQAFDSQNACEEKNTFYCLTPADTDINDDSLLLIGSLTGHEGFIHYNAVESVDVDGDGVDCDDLPTFVPRDFPHLISTQWIHSSNSVAGAGDGNSGPADIAVAFNGAGRNFNGTAFDTISPLNITAPHNDDVSVNGFGTEDINFVTVTWIDQFTAGGAYEALGGTVVATGNDQIPQGIFPFNDIEVGFSCGDWLETCATCKGISDSSTVDEGESVCSLAFRDLDLSGGPIDPILDKEPDDVVCNFDGPHDGALVLIGVTATDNVINLIGPENTGDWAGIDYAVGLGDEPPTPTPTPTPGCDGTPTACFEDPICEDNTALCGGLGEQLGGQSGVNCNDGIDNDDNDQTDCADFKCDGIAVLDPDNPEGPTIAVCEFGLETNCTDGFDNDTNGLTDCDDTGFCSTAEVCETGGGGGSSGSCSIATGSVGLANALILLVPAFGIGFRRIRRRLSK